MYQADQLLHLLLHQTPYKHLMKLLFIFIIFRLLSNKITTKWKLMCHKFYF